MAIPMTARAVVFNAIVATTTTELHTITDFNSMPFGSTLLLEVVGASTPNFTLDIQGKTHPSGTYVNLDYQQIWQAGVSAFANAQLTVNDTTRRFYIVPNTPQFVQLIGTFTAGTLTVYVSLTSEPFTQWLHTTARGSIFTEGPAASDAAEAGNPVQIGISVDETSPAVAGEGDVRRVRGSPEGNVYVEGGFVSGGAGTNPIAIGGVAGNGTINTIRTKETPADTETLANNFWLYTAALSFLTAPDGGVNLGRAAGDVAPGLGALNVAPIGGDMTLRASAAISTTSGTGAALDNVGWVKSFVAHLDVTGVRTGGSTAKLDVYIQTQLASGDWQDIVHFTQVAQAVTHEIVAWGPVDGDLAGLGAEGAAVTYDRFFAEADAALAATTVRLTPLGDSMRVKWVYTAGDSTGGDYTFALVMTVHT